MKRVHRQLAIMVALIGMGLAHGAAMAQETTIPISDKYFLGKLIFFKDYEVKFLLREGAMLTISEGKASPDYFGFALYLGSGSPNIKVQKLQIALSEEGAGRIFGPDRPSETRLGEPLEIRGNSVIQLVLSKMGEKQFSTPPAIVRNQAAYLKERCCILCGDRQVCANAVVASCGKCGEFE